MKCSKRMDFGWLSRGLREAVAGGRPSVCFSVRHLKVKTMGSAEVFPHCCRTPKELRNRFPLGGSTPESRSEGASSAGEENKRILMTVRMMQQQIIVMS
ncbi:hypothetical protein R1flu_008450 [Riccia fluitans]|uniref:Uncharacterized protein n=1 Tax=Riccia fluitans TaxID=41844 RepID=A0ABD1YBX8_9MARC